jgi:hypothetical protein
MRAETRIGMALTATVGLACALATALVTVDFLFVWTGLRGVPLVLLWSAVTVSVLASATRTLARAVVPDTRWLRALVVLAATLSATAAPSVAWARLSNAWELITLVEVVELFFAPLALLWAPVLALLATRGLPCGGPRGFRPTVRHLVAACALVALSVGLYGGMRVAGAGAHERVLVALVVALPALPFFGATLLGRPLSS